METIEFKDTIIATCIKNPFDPMGSREVKLLPAGLPVSSYLNIFYPELTTDYEIVLAIDGVLIEVEDKYDRICYANTSLVFSAVPQKGDTWRTVLQIVVVIIAIVVSYYAGPAGYTIMGLNISGGVAAALVMGAGNMLINAFVPASLPDIANSAFGGTDNFSKSISYGWGVSKNSELQGVTAPIIYGTRRITPPVIGRYVETIGDQQYLNLLYLIADHAVDSISDIRIDSNSVENYQNVLIETRLGSIDQPVIQFFNDTKEDTYVGVLVNTDWTERQTTGNLVEGLGIAISFPRGLYYQNDQGGLSETSVDVEIEFKRTDASEWTRLSSYVTVSTPTSTAHWSGGNWVYDDLTGIPTWTEIENGGTVGGAHYEGEIYYITETVWINFEYVWNGIDGYYTQQQRAVYSWRWVDYGIVNVITTPYVDYVRIIGSQASPIRKVWFREHLTSGKYDVRMRFKTAPSSNIRYVNATVFDFITEIIYDDFKYPGASLLAVRALANEGLANAIQKVDCLVTRSTVQVWTGAAYESKEADLPPWACYDLLHNSEYGGNIDYNRIPIAKWLEWETYCNDKDLKCNIYFDTISNTRKALDAVSQSGRGVVVQMGSWFTCLIDKEESLPVQRFLFTPANIIKDSFNYAYVPYTDRADAVEITYWDEAVDYENQMVTVTSEFYESNVREIKTTQLSLYSITNRQQAINHGKFLLNCNRYLSLIASWDADVDAIACMPGDVVEIGWDYGGRILDATTTTVRCDREISIVGGTYEITIKHQVDDSREDRTIASAITDPAWNSGSTYIIGNYVSYDGHSYICIQAITSTPAPAITDSRYWQLVGTGFNLSTPWTAIPVKYSLYSVGTTGMTTKLVRVLSINRSKDLRRKITALEYVAEVYDDVSTIPTPIPVFELGITFLTAIEKWELGKDGSGQSNVYLTWKGQALSYSVYYKTETGGWVNVGATRVLSFCIEKLMFGTVYTFSVAENSGSPEKGKQISLTILGKDILPEDVAGFNAIPQNDGSIELLWNHVSDIDRWGYEIREGLTWAAGTIAVDRIQENRTRIYKGIAGTYQFLIKAIDDSGNYSATATAVTVTTNITTLNIVYSEDELTTIPPANGVFTNTMYAPDISAIALICGMVDTDADSLDDTMAILTDFDGEEVFTGDYTSPAYDLGVKTVFTLRATTEYDSDIRQAVDTTIATRTNMTYPNDTDIDITSNSTQLIYCAFSDDDITYTGWQIFEGVIQADARYLKIKVECTIDTFFTSFEWYSIAHSADVADKILRILNQAIDVAGTTLTLAGLSLTIVTEYYVGVTVLGSSSIWPVVNKATDQFTVKTFNAAGAVASNVDIEIRGF